MRLLALVLLVPAAAAAAPSLSLWAGGGVGTRRLLWVDPVTSNLRPYGPQAFPVVEVGADLAGPSDPSLGDLGAFASYGSSVGLRSRIEGGPSWSTRLEEAEVGPRLRLGRPGSLQITLRAALGATSFTIDASAAADAPSFTYVHARAGADVRAPLGPVALLAGASYLPVLSAGKLADAFRGATVRGVQGELGAAVVFSPVVEARALFTYRHFAHDFTPLPGQDHVAGGALDQLLGASLSLQVTP